MTKGRKPKLKEIPSTKDLKRHFRNRFIRLKKIEHFDKKVVEKHSINHKLPKELKQEWFLTGIKGFDELTEKGIPKGSTVLISGGAGTGKTIFCLQTAYNVVKQGGKALYLSYEESVLNLKKHMVNFGWDPNVVEDSNGPLMIIKEDPFETSSAVEAMLAEAKGELLIDIKDIIGIVPKGFKPDFIVVDSISAIAAAFGGKSNEYRIYIEQLFEYFRSLKGVTTFLVSETEQVPKQYSRTGTEEFLADGVTVLYNLRVGNIRNNALEILKMRGTKIKKKIVPFKIEDNIGMVIFPEEQLFQDEFRYE